MDTNAYRKSESEQQRTADLLRILPRGRSTVLDIGARDGHFSRLLAEHFDSVVALDLARPSFEFERVATVAGDVTRLGFPDCSFDCVFCAEVLEHVQDVEKACSEIVRVARHEIVVGVPFRQDIRLGRTTCRACGRVSPPWGHINSFTEERLKGLFRGLTVVSRAFTGSTEDATNAVSALLMDLAGNPWGTYSQEEGCVHCGAKLAPPAGHRSFLSHAASGLAFRLNALQRRLAGSHPAWIQVVFSKTG